MIARRLLPPLLAWLTLSVLFAAGWYTAKATQLAQPPHTPPSPPPAPPETSKPSAPAAQEPAAAADTTAAATNPGAPSTLKSLYGPNPQEIVRNLSIKPGATVLDVEADDEALLWALARATGPKGLVWASAHDDELRKRLENAASREQLRQVTFFMIHNRDRAAFYQDHVFDLIFVHDPFKRWPHPLRLLRTLGASLRPETGRLVILRGLLSETFYAYQFGRPFLRQRFVQEGETFPPFSRLPASLRTALTTLKPGALLPLDQRQELARRFSDMLDDQKLFWEINAHHNAKHDVASQIMELLPDEEIALMRWLVLHFDDQGIFAKPLDALSPAQRSALRSLNYLTLLPYFDQASPRPGFRSEDTLCLNTKRVQTLLSSIGLLLERRQTNFKGFELSTYRASRREDQAASR